MGNQQSVGWASIASLNRDKVINIWIESWKEIYKDFTDEELRITTNREEYFRKGILKHLRNVATRKFAIYRSGDVLAYAILEEKKDSNTNEPFIQIYGFAVNPFNYIRKTAYALATFIKREYPEHEFRGMVRAINERGQRLYKWIGAVECDDWHDEEYDEFHVPLRIPSIVAISALNKAEQND